MQIYSITHWGKTGAGVSLHDTHWCWWTCCNMIVYVVIFWERHLLVWTGCSVAAESPRSAVFCWLVMCSAAACVYSSRHVLLWFAVWRNLRITLCAGRRIRVLLQGEIWWSQWTHKSPVVWWFVVLTGMLCCSLNCYWGQTESGALSRLPVNERSVIFFPAVLNTIGSNRNWWGLMQISKAESGSRGVDWGLHVGYSLSH